MDISLLIAFHKQGGVAWSVARLPGMQESPMLGTFLL